ncbi:hypothetical protein GUJ93_ZPchr0003g17374 [Zizania palustris]|uniref:Uncharacterized protein n=1 Tax=Zizania palustris TaxID=103762 RepID=A0A8J5V5Z8_ZIZPA|nr:hypothetical protein GUJ93_ZPchr0003g17374 [Zizania palustris]
MAELVDTGDEVDKSMLQSVAEEAIQKEIASEIVSVAEPYNRCPKTMPPPPAPAAAASLTGHHQRLA